MGTKKELADVRGLDDASLKAHLLVLLKEQFELRMQHHNGQLSDISKLSKAKKAIARVRTIMNEKKLAQKVESTNE